MIAIASLPPLREFQIQFSICPLPFEMFPNFVNPVNRVKNIFVAAPRLRVRNFLCGLCVLCVSHHYFILYILSIPVKFLWGCYFVWTQLKSRQFCQSRLNYFRVLRGFRGEYYSLRLRVLP